jgi:hypothetical protein
MLFRMGSRTTALALAAALALGAACSNGGDDDGAESTARTTRRASSTTTSTRAEAPLWPLTGLPLTDAARGQRPVLVVKIDNAPLARPQAGLNQADVVVSEKVEDGVTRLFVLFHSGDADPVGPVRSARTTDITLVTPLRRPLFAYSGTNPTFQRLIDQAPLVDVGISRAPGDYARDNGRPRPYNLFSSTGKLWAHAPPDAQPPPPMFRYGDHRGGEPATRLHLEYRGENITTIVDYAFDTATGTWNRAQDGTPHVDAAGQQVAPRNVVVQFVEYRDTGARDTSGAIVPEAQLVGGGEAWLLRDGKVTKGRWEKASPEAVTRFVDTDGTELALAPGQTWLELPPPGSGTLP